MGEPRGLAAAVTSGLRFIRQAQQPDGGFLAFMPGQAAGHQTTFVASLIGGALGPMEGPASDSPDRAAVQQGITAYLLDQKSPYWSYNYWPRRSTAATARPYPDDLDCTFCALTALHLAQPDRLGPADFATIIKLLTAQETTVGGPYRTWVVQGDDDDRWSDVDLAVNANIGGFLHTQDIHLPNLDSLVDQAVATGHYTTPYYPSEYPVLYFISRFYQGSNVSQLRTQLLQRRGPDGAWGNPTDTALAVLALLNFGESPAGLTRAIKFLLNTQARGGWAPSPVYREEKNNLVSSPALTAAFAVAALSQFQQASSPAKRPLAVQTLPVAAQKLRAGVIARVQTRFAAPGPDFNRVASAALDRLLRQDQDGQIILLPYIWGQALAPPAPQTQLLGDLGAASLYGWVAYTIYDDFLDAEGQPSQLPVASLALRCCIEIFTRAFPPPSPYYGFISRILDQIDAANAWEVMHCRATVTDGQIELSRIPDYGDLHRLAGRSLGHALGPLCLLFSRGVPTTNPAVTATLGFFEHYLIARQLNDDAHDWEADLRRGIINSAAAQILGSLPGPNSSPVQLQKLLPRLHQQFWAHQITSLCAEINHHTALARRALAANSLLQETSALEALLVPLEASANQALHEQTATVEFMEAYQRKPKFHN